MLGFLFHPTTSASGSWVLALRGLICIWLVLSSEVLSGQNITEDQKHTAGHLANSELGGMPLLFRTPETGWALGGVFLYTSGLDQKRVSPIISGLMYTEKKQILWGIGGRQIINGGDSSLYAYSEFAKFPQTFFGVGRATRREDATLYQEQRHMLEFGGDQELVDHLSVGGGFILRNDNFYSLEPEGKGLLGEGLYFGEQGGPQRGLQFYLLWESTNDNYFPSEGIKAQFFTQHYTKILGTRYPFTAQKFDGRHYHSFSKLWIQAQQFYIQNIQGDAPFYQLSQLGGNDLLRGYFKGRYRDNKLILAQTESRYRFSKYWNLAVFGGYGNVAKEWQDMPDVALKPSYGTGLRYQITPKQKLNVRLDLGWGQKQGGPQVYLYVMEAY